MNLELRGLLNGARAELCSLTNGNGGTVIDFLQTLADEKECQLLCVLHRLAERGGIENPEIYSRISGCVGLFRISIPGVELACFQDGRRLLICGHSQGKLSKASVAHAKMVQTQYFASKPSLLDHHKELPTSI